MKQDPLNVSPSNQKMYARLCPFPEKKIIIDLVIVSQLHNVVDWGDCRCGGIYNTICNIRTEHESCLYKVVISSNNLNTKYA